MEDKQRTGGREEGGLWSHSFKVSLLNVNKEPMERRFEKGRGGKDGNCGS